MHRQTVWFDADGNAVRCAVACLDGMWEPHAEVTLDVGPFHPLDERLLQARDIAHGLGGWRAHQEVLELG